MRYEVVESVLHIFDEGAELPFIIQPSWPSGEAWGVGEAEAWAEQTILALTDSTAELAGPSPSMPKESRPVFDEAPLELPPPPALDELPAPEVG